MQLSRSNFIQLALHEKTNVYAEVGKLIYVVNPQPTSLSFWG